MSTISDLLSALRTSPADTAHDLGYALPGLDDGSLRELRNELATLDTDDPLLGAAAAVLVDVVDGFRAARRERVTFALPDGINRAVLCQLENGPATTSELARTLHRAESQVSRAISRLRQLDLIDPPHRSAVDGRVVEHRLSITAKQALARIDAVARRQPVWMLSAFDAANDHPMPVEDEPSASVAIAAAARKNDD